MGPVFVWFWVGARLKTEGVVSEGSSAPTAGGPLDAQAVAVINVSGRLDYEHAHSLDRRSEGSELCRSEQMSKLILRSSVLQLLYWVTRESKSKAWEFRCFCSKDKEPLEILFCV